MVFQYKIYIRGLVYYPLSCQKPHFSEVYDTDVMTGDRDRRMYLYYQLVGSLRKAVSVDIIVSFLMESGVKMLLTELENAALKIRSDFLTIC